MRSAAQRLSNTASLAAPLSNASVVHMGRTPCKCACKMADEPANSRHYAGGLRPAATQGIKCFRKAADNCIGIRPQKNKGRVQAWREQRVATNDTSQQMGMLLYGLFIKGPAAVGSRLLRMGSSEKMGVE